MKIRLFIPFLLVLITGCSEEKITSDQLSNNSIPVEVAAVERGTFKSTIKLVGRLIPSEQAIITSDMPLPIEKIHVQNGDDVKKGMVLFTLENDQIEKQLSQAESLVATLVNTKAQLNETILQQKAAQTEIKEILDESIKRIQGSAEIEQQDLEVLKKETITALKQLQTLTFQADAPTSSAAVLIDKQIQQAQESVIQLRKTLDSTQITSQINGTIDKLNASVGAPAFPSQPLAVVSNNSGVKVIFSANEFQIDQLKEGMPITVFIAGSDKTSDSKIDSISSKIDTKTNTYTVMVPLEQKDNVLKPDNVITAEVTTYNSDEALIIPTTSLLFEGGNSYVFVVENNQAIKRPVKIKNEQKRTVEVKSGLTENELVVTDGKYQLINGSQVSFEK